MKYIIYILIFVLTLSCKSKIKFEKPDNLLSKEQMIDLLTDMHIANGASGINNINEEKNKQYMSLVYEKYNIDSVRFAESNMYYTANVNEYEQIFLEVEKRLEVLKKKYETESDSISKKEKELREGSMPKKKLDKDDYDDY